MLNKHKKVYISGKITGLPFEEYSKNFNEVEEYLRYKGYTNIINPIKLNPYNPDWTWEQYMKPLIKELVDCDELWLIGGWQGSKGVEVELYLADTLGIKVIDYGIK